MAATEATKRYVRGQAVRSYSRGDAVLLAIDDFAAGGAGTRQFIHADHLDAHNAAPQPFVWTAALKDILPKIIRAHETLDTLRNQ